MSNQHSPKQSSSSQSSAPQFIKGVQKLIDSEDEQVSSSRLQELQAELPLLKKMNEALSNRDKLQLFLRDSTFRHRLQERLYHKGLLARDPIIKVELYSLRYRSNIEEELDTADLEQTFSRFGKVTQIYVEKTYSYLMFDTHLSAYLAIKSLNEFEIVEDVLRISVGWCPQEDLQLATNFFIHNKPNQKSGKKMCQYEFCIECGPDFKLTQKIIGPKGSHMKKVLEKVKVSLRKNNIEEVGKLRLRGRGSGFKEGPNNVEAEENLHLCVTSKDNKCYSEICQEVEQLLDRIAQDYRLFYKKFHKAPPQGIVYRKMELTRDGFQETKRLCLEQIENDNCLDFMQAPTLSEADIEEMIHERNLARKQGRYREADEMREKLRKRGVCLIDEKKGGKNRASVASRWRYA